MNIWQGLQNIWNDGESMGMLSHYCLWGDLYFHDPLLANSNTYLHLIFKLVLLFQILQLCYTMDFMHINEWAWLYVYHIIINTYGITSLEERNFHSCWVCKQLLALTGIFAVCLTWSKDVLLILPWFQEFILDALVFLCV